MLDNLWHRFLERTIQRNITSFSGGDKDNPTFETRRLFTVCGFTVCLHGFRNIDTLDEFHTHPYNAWRWVLSGWYEEQYLTLPWSAYKNTDRECDLLTQKRSAGYMSFVGIEYVHRISKVGKKPVYDKAVFSTVSRYSAISLWIHKPKTAPVIGIRVEWNDPYPNIRTVGDDHFSLFEK